MARASVETAALRKAGASHWWSCMGTGSAGIAVPTTLHADKRATIRPGWKEIDLNVPGKNYPTISFGANLTEKSKKKLKRCVNCSSCQSLIRH